MLAWLGLLTILMLLFLVMTKRMAAVVALIIVPIITSLLAGFTTEIVGYITEGLKSIAPTGVMFIFAILFFGILTDAGTFKPLIKKILRFAGNDPAKVTVATALLAMMIHLDGSGAVTFLVTIPALLPLYNALNMKRTTLATVTALAAGTMNILPWGGPTIRAAAALEVSVTTLFNPILVPVLIGLISVLVIAYILGRKERNNKSYQIKGSTFEAADIEETELERPKLFYLNIAMILIVVALLISGIAPPHIIFMVAFAVAITLNYPKPDEQGERINAHAQAALLMASILFAAGCFTGILKGSGMIDAMAEGTVALIPQSVGSHLAVITGIISMPASLLFDPDSFYFGILPLISTTASHFGVESVEVGRAAIMGQMTTGFPVSPLTGSTYLLIGLTGVDLGEHQRKTIPWAFLVTLIILLFSLLIGAITW